MSVKKEASGRRNSNEVAARAIVFGALGFRASLEVTAHPRSQTLCLQLLPWLEQLNLGDRIEEFHAEILKTPHQRLSRESQTEALWRGEAASLLGWAIELFDKPNPTVDIEPGLLVSKLRLLQPNATELISAACLRPQSEIDDYCAFCLTVRHHFQISALDKDGHAVLQHLHQTRLAELGLSLGLSGALDRQREIEIEAGQLVSAAPNVRGLYVVRALTSEWLLGKDE
jgi:hypothetical protein